MARLAGPGGHLFEPLFYRNEGIRGTTGTGEDGFQDTFVTGSGSVGGFLATQPIVYPPTPPGSARFRSLPALSRGCVNEEMQGLCKVKSRRKILCWLQAG